MPQPCSSEARCSVGPLLLQHFIHMLGQFRWTTHTA